MRSQAIEPRIDTVGHGGVASTPSVFRYESTDIHEYCANLQGWHLAYDQLSAGAFRGSLTSIRFPRLEIFREVTSRKTRQSGTLGADSFTIGVAWAETAVPRCNGASISGPDAFILSLDAEIELFTPDDFEVRGLSASASMIRHLAADMGLDWPPTYDRRMLGVRATSASVGHFKMLLCLAQESVRARRNLEGAWLATRVLEDSLLTHVLDLVATGTPLGTSARARKRTVDRARDLMLSLDGKAMTLLDVCRHVGASPRKLAYCFHDQLGVSPGYYWKVIRLNRARKDLLDSASDGTDIYSVAARHGFWHFSQFSHDYKRHFEERPSDTLRNARERRPQRVAT